jgi:hypothetical protein
LRDQIVADLIAARSLVKQGSLAGVGKNSANQSYKSYGPGSHTQTQEVDNLADLIGLYDQLKSKITSLFTHSADFDYTVPDDYDFDPEILKQLTDLFTAMSSDPSRTLPDITGLRLPGCVNFQPSPATW